MASRLCPIVDNFILLAGTGIDGSVAPLGNELALRPLVEHKDEEVQCLCSMGRAVGITAS